MENVQEIADIGQRTQRREGSPHPEEPHAPHTRKEVMATSSPLKVLEEIPHAPKMSDDSAVLSSSSASPRRGEGDITNNQLFSMMSQMVTNSFAQQERMRHQDARIEALLEERSIASSRRDDEGRSNQEIGYLVQEKVPMEASRAPYKARSLEGRNFPESWPRYVWPKDWKGATDIHLALVALKEMQETSTLIATIRELREKCIRNNRSLFADQWRILQTAIAGKTCMEHDCWEICLIGNSMCPATIAQWLLLCRSVDPLHATDVGWAYLAAGGQWPALSTGGQNVGNRFARHDKHSTPDAYIKKRKK